MLLVYCFQALVLVLMLAMPVAASLELQSMSVTGSKNYLLVGPIPQFSGTTGNLTFECVAGCVLPTGVVLDEQTGQLFGFPTQEGVFNNIVIGAIDQSTNATVNFTMNLNIGAAGSQYNTTSITSPTIFFEGVPVSYTPPSILAQFPHVAQLLDQLGSGRRRSTSGSGGDVLTFFFYSGTLPEGVSFNPLTATFSGTPSESGTVGDIVISGLQTTGVPFVLVVLENVQVYGDDCSQPTNGPGGRSCAMHSTCIDEVAFDFQFTCLCHDGYTGNNCDTVVPAGVPPALAIGLGVGSAIGLCIIIAIAVWRCTRWKHSHNQIGMMELSTFTPPTPDVWEFDRTRLMFSQQIGKGMSSYLHHGARYEALFSTILQVFCSCVVDRAFSNMQREIGRCSQSCDMNEEEKVNQLPTVDAEIARICLIFMRIVWLSAYIENAT
eukprot:m.77771 g.77771  ORF g.77771 m.77771 type:complete len:436 (+) comp12512_c0_seq3:134-1441(+)